MRRRLLYSSVIIGEGTITASETSACDICLYDKNNDGLVIVQSDAFIEKVFPSSHYSPVGVVVVPGNHDVYGTGECGVISIVPMNCSTPATGGTSEQSMYWGVNGTDISGLTDYSYAPYVGTGTEVGDSTSTVTGQYILPFLPSDNFSAVQCPHDTDTYYYSSSSSYYQAPSPYLTDDSRNPAYYQTSSPSSTSNALADFDGTGNTDIIIDARGTKDYISWLPTYDTQADYPAASCCDMYYTDGTKQGDWYLPACGELGYITPKFTKINSTISTLNTAYGVGVQLSSSDFYWSSSENYKYGARAVSTSDGNVGDYDGKYSKNYARAFLRVK